MSPVKTAATQEVLGDLFDRVDDAADYADVLHLALLAVHEDEAFAAATVVSDLADMLKAIKAKLYDMVEWA